MEPRLTGQKYDKIAKWRHNYHRDSGYGLDQIKRAIEFSPKSGTALDIGCGAGGRYVRLLQDTGFAVTGIDVSPKMIEIARKNHPDEEFYTGDITEWHSDDRYDFIVAWDSLFHLPLASQKPVLAKICSLLAPGGVLIYTFGDAVGEHTDTWHDDEFYYSAIGIDENLNALQNGGVTCKHLELDQWPEKHVFIIGMKDA